MVDDGGQPEAPSPPSPSSSKRRRIQSPGSHGKSDQDRSDSLMAHKAHKRSAGMPLRSAYPIIGQCSSIDDYERLNHIEEGSYGVVFRAKHKPTGDIVALKKLKMDRERNGFPITSLREIRTLMMAQHENVVKVREVAVGHTLTQIFIVFEFVEHDLKTLLSTLESPFLVSEIKSLVLQLLKAVALLHSQWIIHRDLKTSNLLLNNRGTLKLADFGLARLYGDPPLQPDDSADGHDSNGMTELVVTLWYRAPELLLGAKRYDVAIDMWSVGCIMAELALQEPLFMGRNEADQISKIFRTLGHPSSSSWPGVTQLPLYAKTLRSSRWKGDAGRESTAWRQRFPSSIATGAFIDLLSQLLCYDPTQRITAHEAISHPWFTEERPRPAHPDTFSSFPSVAAGEVKRRFYAESPPKPKAKGKQAGEDGSRSATGTPTSGAALPSPPPAKKLAEKKLGQASLYQMEWGF